MRLRPAFAIVLSLPLIACGDDGGGAAIDAGPRFDGALTASPDAAVAADCTVRSGTVVADLRLESVASGLSSPVFVTAPPGDTRLFVLEQAGRVRIIQNGTLLPDPFIDISDEVLSGGEQGLLGMAFHPDWAENGLFYLSYTTGSGDGRSIVTEHSVTAVDSNVAAAGSRTILEFEQEATNHNGGMIAFGPDDYLYWGLGDGGGSHDPLERGQDPDTLLGSMLRIDVDAPSGGNQYGIPSDNPFADGNGGRPEVFAYGLRNPWRWSFDRMTGDVYIADVGQWRLEEVNAITLANLSGANFGWDEYEGTECFNDPPGSPLEEGTGCDLAGTVIPIAEYGHTRNDLIGPPPDQVGDSITGGYVYRGACMPDVQGTYFYGDFSSGLVRTLKWNGSAATDTADITSSLKTGVSVQGISSFGEDGFGEMYLISYSNGTIFRIVDPG